MPAVARIRSRWVASWRDSVSNTAVPTGTRSRRLHLGELLDSGLVPLFQTRSLTFDIGQCLVDEAVAGSLDCPAEELSFRSSSRNRSEGTGAGRTATPTSIEDRLYVVDLTSLAGMARWFVVLSTGVTCGNYPLVGVIGLTANPVTGCGHFLD